MKPCDKGDLGEISVAKELRLQGFDVFLPIGNGTKVDIVVDNGVRLFRIQVKCTSSMKDETATLNLRKNTLNPKYNYNYKETDVDVFALYVDDWDRVVFIASKEAFEGNAKRTMVTFRKARSRSSKSKVIADYGKFPTDL
jgi:hypothetical protein